jgi:uncharacterized coiled-coil protein SlyX
VDALNEQSKLVQADYDRLVDANQQLLCEKEAIDRLQANIAAMAAQLGDSQQQQVDALVFFRDSLQPWVDLGSSSTWHEMAEQLNHLFEEQQRALTNRNDQACQTIPPPALMAVATETMTIQSTDGFSQVDPTVHVDVSIQTESLQDLLSMVKT